MRILAVETATEASSVALGDGDGVRASSRVVDPRGHVRFLAPAIDFCFRMAGWARGDLDAVAVDVGPGLFSGIRTGLSTAQAVAGALGVPLVGVSSLDAVAFQAATAHRRIWAVVDVRRGEVAVCPYRPVPGGVVRDGAVELCSPEAFRGLVQEDPSDILVVGQWASLPEGSLLGLRSVKMGRPVHPAATAVLEIARGRLERGDVPHPDEVRPTYLREPDVTINWADFRTEGPWI